MDLDFRFLKTGHVAGLLEAARFTVEMLMERTRALGSDGTQPRPVRGRQLQRALPGLAAGAERPP